MSTDIEEIEKQALELDRAERARLAVRLLDSLEAVSDPRNERLWIREAERRIEEFRARAVKPLPAGPILRRARQLARERRPHVASRKRSHSIR